MVFAFAGDSTTTSVFPLGFGFLLNSTGAAAFAYRPRFFFSSVIVLVIGKSISSSVTSGKKYENRNPCLQAGSTGSYNTPGLAGSFIFIFISHM